MNRGRRKRGPYSNKIVIHFLKVVITRIHKPGPYSYSSLSSQDLNGAPEWLKVLSNILPLNHLIDGIHAALDGNAAGMLAPVGILAAYTMLAMVLAVVTFRWDPDTTVTQRFLRIA